MMRKREKGKLTGKAIRCIASAVCVLGVLAVCLGIAGYQNKVQAENDQVVTRGVVDSLGQIPQTKKDLYDTGTENTKETLGTKENPFLILEVVPYEEYALFGYHISGCEPLDMDKMYGHTDVMGLIGNLKTADVERQNSAYFFPDEPEADASAYDSDKKPSVYWEKNNSFKGYYERVEEGTGTFIQDANGKLVKKENGNIIWHTICKTEMEKKYSKEKFVSAEEASNTILNEIGKRIYTERINTEEDPVLITYGYYYYENNDNFLKNSLALTDEAAKDYSVIIKTITPSQLNQNREWLDYTDLFIFSGKEYYQNLSSIWKTYNRLGNQSNTTSYVDGFANNDIDWKCAQKIFDRVSATQNYAAIIMGTSLYKPGGSMLSGTTKESTTLKVYDWNLKETTSTVDSGIRSNNNVYKLAVMLLSMDHDLFRNLYLTDENPLGHKLIDDDGNFLLRQGDDQSYWSIYSFLTIPPVEETGYINPYDYWNQNQTYGLWDTHGIIGNINDGNYNVRIDGHVYTFNDDNALSFDYTASSQVPNSKFTDYQKYLNEYYDVADGTNHGGTPSDAVRYILGENSKQNKDKITGTLNVLDIEPCYDYETKEWTLTKSYIRMMIPDFVGKIEIRHMTTAEYVGYAKDLNSTYDLIFMGLDCRGYNLGSNGLPDWNDNTMDGKIYFHTGDVFSYGNYLYANENHSVDYLWSEDTKERIDSQNLRFPGNDITTLKKKELENFLAAGYPVVAVPYLYNTDGIRIDQHSHICNFMKENKEKKSLYVSTDTAKIEEAVRNGKPEVEFTQVPASYDGSTDSSGSATIKNPNYLERDSMGRVLLRFNFLVKNPAGKQYQCRIYIDQNQDGKFADKELVYTGKQFSEGEQSVTLPLSKLYMGVIQWKIEVYQVENENIHFVKTGCSAAKHITGGKKQIKVLQIKPDKYCTVDLKTDTVFTKYYDSLDDYSISMETMGVSKFLALFQDHKFVFDFSKDVTYEGTSLNPSQISPEQSQLFDDYDMLIIGFGDRYGYMDIDNDNGAVDFIKYFVAEGKSVLFTHDLTSMNTSKEGNDVKYWFGLSANMLMRDVMGMNRYKAVSARISEDERNKIIGYQSKHKYDTVTDINGDTIEENHGYTYYCMRRLGKNPTDIHMPYQTLTNSTNEFSVNCCVTSKVTQTNEGQITQYPYKIDQTFYINDTHGQYYQVNVEDPEVTVWYCLSGNQIYDLSPNDVANNYYIFSKENVFYSGVGHSCVTNPMEAKLFINTMIAAYRASYDPPMVEVLNPEAELMDINDLSYQLSFAQEYNNTVEETASENNNEEMTKIYFCPEELNAISSKLDCSLYYDVNNTKEYIDVIYDRDTDQPIYPARDENGQLKLDGDGNPYYEDLKNMKEYYFLYPEKYLNEWKDATGTEQQPRRNIVFKIKNDRVKKPGYTKLNMSVQALFQLD